MGRFTGGLEIGFGKSSLRYPPQVKSIWLKNRRSIIMMSGRTALRDKWLAALLPLERLSSTLERIRIKFKIT